MKRREGGGREGGKEEGERVLSTEEAKFKRIEYWAPSSGSSLFEWSAWTSLAEGQRVGEKRLKGTHLSDARSTSSSVDVSGSQVDSLGVTVPWCSPSAWVVVEKGGRLKSSDQGPLSMFIFPCVTSLPAKVLG